MQLKMLCGPKEGKSRALTPSLEGARLCSRTLKRARAGRSQGKGGGARGWREAREVMNKGGTKEQDKTGRHRRRRIKMGQERKSR